jgi:hypothetical protein
VQKLQVACALPESRNDLAAPTESLSHELAYRGRAHTIEAPVPERVSPCCVGWDSDPFARRRRGPCPFAFSAVRDFIYGLAWIGVEGSSRCGVSVPGLRFVDAANGVLGIEWVNGKSVRYLLGSRDEGESDEDEGEVAAADENPLSEYAISKGTISLWHLSGYHFSHET